MKFKLTTTVWLLAVLAFLFGPALCRAELRPEFRALDSDPALEHHWLLGESSNSGTVTDRITAATAELGGSANTEDRNAPLFAVWQEHAICVGVDPDENGRLHEPLVLLDSPGTSCTSDEWSCAFYIRTPQAFGRPILSVTDRSTGCAVEITGGASAGIVNQQLEVKFSQDGTTYNKHRRTVATVFGTGTHLNFPVTSINPWIHIVVTYSAANQEIKVYRNGIELELTSIADSGTWGIFDSTADLIIGNYDGGGSTDQQPMFIADVRMYSRVLEPQEVNAMLFRYKVIDPTRDTYHGYIPWGEDLQPALQVVFDTAGNTNANFQHAPYHHCENIDIPHGHWIMGQSAIEPFGASGLKITGRGNGSRVGTSVAKSWTHLIRSDSWTGSAQALLTLRGRSEVVSNIRFVGTYSGDAEDCAGYGVHQTRNGDTTSIPPSGLLLSNCSGEGLVALHVTGLPGANENNCDFNENINCSIANCNYGFWSTNDQSQMNKIDRFIGSGNLASIYVQRGGPIYISRFGSSGSVPFLLIGTAEANQGHFVLEKGKQDAQSDPDWKIVAMENPGPANIIVRDVFFTRGAGGSLGTNFVLRGHATLVVEDCVGPGKAECIAAGGGGQNTRIPMVYHNRCKYEWFSDYPNSPAALAKNNPKGFLATEVGFIKITDPRIGTRNSDIGIIDPNPQSVRDYNPNARSINVNIGGPPSP